MSTPLPEPDTPPPIDPVQDPPIDPTGGKKAMHRAYCSAAAVTTNLHEFCQMGARRTLSITTHSGALNVVERLVDGIIRLERYGCDSLT
jgi:hypothetical protein